LSGHQPYSGLRWTFVIMLLPLSASAVFLFRAIKSYPTDVVTAGLVVQRSLPPGPGVDQPTHPAER
jgi:hypothetical protein